MFPYWASHCLHCLHCLGTALDSAETHDFLGNSSFLDSDGFPARNRCSHAPGTAETFEIAARAPLGTAESLEIAARAPLGTAESLEIAALAPLGTTESLEINVRQPLSCDLARKNNRKARLDRTRLGSTLLRMGIHSVHVYARVHASTYIYI